MGGKLEELSPENIFKKIDSFFLNVEEQRKKIDNDMCKTSKLNSEIKRIKQKIN